MLKSRAGSKMVIASAVRPALHSVHVEMILNVKAEVIKAKPGIKMQPLFPISPPPAAHGPPCSSHERMRW